MIVSGIVLLDVMFFFFFNDTATTEIYTLSLHDALPISCRSPRHSSEPLRRIWASFSSISWRITKGRGPRARSEEHTSELQSQSNLVCRLLLEKKTLPPYIHSLLPITEHRLLASTCHHTD